MIPGAAPSAVLLLAGLALMAWAGVAESTLVVMAKSSVRSHLGASRVRTQAVADLLDTPFRTWLTLAIVTLAGVLLVGFGLTGIAFWWLHGAQGIAAAALAALVVLPAAYLAPRAVAPRSAELAAVTTAPLPALRFLMTPLLAPLEGLAAALGPNGSADLPSAMAFMRTEDPRTLLDVEDEGLLEEGEREMIVSIFELGDTKVREVMVPRIDIVAIPADAGLDESLDIILEAGHSRIPIYRDSIDDIVGLLYAKDLLSAFRKRDFAPSIPTLLREPYFIPESKPVDELLADLQRRQVHMAIVVDEYGGTAGLVTIEDLLEEIVGEIQDEYDVEEARVELVSDDEGIFHAGVDIDDVNRLMDIHLPTRDVDTLAGLVFTSLGKVPEVGESASFEDAHIEVLSVTGRRINRVRVRRSGSTDGAVLPEAPSNAETQR